MGRFNDRARQYLAVLVRIIGVKKEKPKHDAEVDTKVDAKVDCCTCCHGFEAHTAPEHESTVVAKKGWKYRPNAEVPWRLEQVVEKEENWRGTWVLEVKDLRMMDWGTTRVPKADRNRRGGRYHRQPTRHLLFPADGDEYRETLTGGQDDLLVQLGKR
ncbi:uncharacterized protein ColSpa_06256 [Colletotrichum spaethianum]|uniref:Uncharacterized protein n=1 Tax=Colletotrichum spaethianum TaxID=700344 RepID=A0AA37LHI4_9PEZI|nr:uncharacterized protein ColSpa_06256 [Colletotrichum spaethianum]GKT46075.1 hypothetical protein ColSpa_06256 [Colletotrichum spaethianum]